MPVIREYGAQTNVQGSGGIVQGVDYGGLLGDLGGRIQQASDRIKDIQGRQEVSDVQRRVAAARADLTVELTKRSTEAQPGDPDFAQNFNAHVQDYLGKQGVDYATPQGQTAWQTASSELASQFVETAGVYQIQSAGVKARQDYDTALDLNRNVLQHDPSQLDQVLKSTLDALRDPNGMYAKMPAEQRAKLENTTKNELGLSAFQGLAAQNPQLALKELNAGEWDSRLDADKMLSANNLAERLIRAQELDIARAQVAADKAAKQQDRAAQDEYFGQLAGDEPNPVIKSIELDPRLSPESKRSMIGVAEADTTRAAQEGRLVRSDAARQAAAEVVSGLLKNDVSVTKTRIADDPNLTPTQKLTYGAVVDAKANHAAAAAAQIARTTAAAAAKAEASRLRDLARQDVADRRAQAAAAAAEKLAEKADQESAAGQVILDLTSDNPTMTPQDIGKNSDLTSAQKLTLIGLAKTTDKATARAKQDAAENTILQDIASGAPTLTKADVMANPDLTPTQKERLWPKLGGGSRSLADISHVVSSDLFTRIHAPDGDPNKITDENELNDEFAAGHLNRPDLDWLRKEVQNARTPEGDMLGKRMTDFFSAVEPQINQKGMFGLPTNPKGAEQMYRFEDMVRRKVQEKKKKGEDPFSLFDPAAPDYLGKPDTVGSYAKSMTENVQDITNTMTSVPGSTPGAVYGPGSSAEQPLGATTPEDAAKLAPGTWFTTTDGRVLRTKVQ